MGGLSGWPLLLQRLVTMLGFILVRFIFMTIQKVYWKINGTTNKIRQSRRPENYDRSVHILDIFLFKQFDIANTYSIRNYILMHNRFESPQYIFDNDHISLITMDEENAIFGVAKEKSMHLWRLEYCSFMRLAQVLLCNQLILVPLNHFHRMAEELGDPKGQLIFLYSTGRCGSTMLTQMMQTTGKCISISEPDSFNALTTLYKNKGDSAHLRQLSKDVLRWTCRPYKDISQLAYMIKVMGMFTYVLPVFKEIYPSSKCLFMYRDPIKVAQSFYRISSGVSTFVMLNTLGKLSPVLTEKCFDYIGGFIGKKFRYKLWDDLSFGVLMVMVSCKFYLEFRRKGLEVNAVRYEDIMKDKHFSARAILKFCDLPMSLEEDFLHGLEFDSQRNSVIARNLLAKRKDPVLTPESECVVNEVFKKNGLPILGDDWLLEGTITYKG